MLHITINILLIPRLELHACFYDASFLIYMLNDSFRKGVSLLQLMCNVPVTSLQTNGSNHVILILLSRVPMGVIVTGPEKPTCFPQTKHFASSFATFCAGSSGVV